MVPGNFIKTFLALTFDLFSLFWLSIYVYTERLIRLIIPRPLKSLDGEIILVTGAGSGIGRQIALKLAAVAPTATIICWDYEKKPNESIVAELKRKNVKAYGYVLDVSNRELVAETAAKIREEIGDVSIVVNNAGIAPTAKFLSQDTNSMQRTVEINFLAHLWILREFVPKMVENNHGHIVSIASLSALLPAKEIAVYAATKHAVHGFIESFKTELRTLPNKPDVQFSTVYPIFVQTRMLEGIKFIPRFEGMIPIITPEYVAEKTVEGFRRNYEHICLPPSTTLMAFARALLPSAIWYKIEDEILKCDVQDTNTRKESIQTGIPNNGEANGHTVLINKEE